MNSPALSIAFVVPRFGSDVVGGAELHALWLANKLSSLGHRVEILTTSASNSITWNNDLAPGVEHHGPLVVRRFEADDRDLGIFNALLEAINDGRRLSREEELLFLRHGVSSSGMEDYLRASGTQYDVIVALPYVHGITYFAHVNRPERTVIVPCLHDEPVAYLGVIGEMLRNAAGLMFNTRPEAELARLIAGTVAPSAVVGVGFEPPAASASFDYLEQAGRPVLLYVGRREEGKNTHLLADFFLRYQTHDKHDLQLVFAGAGKAVPDHPDIHVVEPDWSRRDELYASATVLCQPSTNESLSIAAMQAWLAQRPLLVHGDSAVMRHHCEESGGGLWFKTYPEFEEALDLLLASPELRAKLGLNGAGYVQRTYGWPAVMERFHTALESWGFRRGTLAGAAS